MSGYIGTAPVPQATQNREVFTATAGQTSFATLGYSPTFLDVYMNGIHLLNGTDYTATNGSDVVLTEAASAGDVLEVLSFTPFVTDKFSGVTATSEQLNTLVDNSPSYRNLIINGAMQVAQRGTSVTGVTSQDYYTCDRWKIEGSTGTFGTWTVTQAADGPDGFAKSLKLDCTTANASLSAGSYLLVRHVLPGYDVQRLKKGTASAKSVTLGINVKSNKTGTFVCEIEDFDNNRSISATYTINVADTWTPLTLTFAGDTTGAFNDDNGASLSLNFWLAAGSTYSSGTLATAWGTQVNANRAVGQVNLADTIGNYWQITGVQMEEGEVATEFEHMSYGQHLLRCLPYYWRMTHVVNQQGVCVGGNETTTNAQGHVFFPVPMIQPPHTFEHSGVPGNYLVRSAGVGRTCTAVPTGQVETFDVATVTFVVASGLVVGDASQLRFTSSGYLAWSAEL